MNDGSVDGVGHDGARNERGNMRGRMCMMKLEMKTAGAITLLTAGDDAF